MSHNKYLSDSESSYDSDEDIDIHEVVRSGTFQEVKEAIALDRPRLIALKDEVHSTFYSTHQPFSFAYLLLFCSHYTVARPYRPSLCSRAE